MKTVQERTTSVIDVPATDATRDNDTISNDLAMTAETSESSLFDKTVIYGKSASFVRDPEFETQEQKTEDANTVSKIRSAMTLGGYALGGGAQIRVTDKMRERSDRRTAAAKERWAHNEEDSRAKKFGKSVMRGFQEHYPTIVPAAVTIAGAAWIGYKLFHGADTPGFTRVQNPEVTNAVFSTDILAGGHGDPDGAMFQQQYTNIGQANGHEIVTAKYPAKIGPLDDMTMRQSTAIGANDIYDKYKTAPDGDVRIVGYSEGTKPAIDAANMIAAENGGQLPGNVKLILYAPPYGPNGFFNGNAAKTVSPILGGLGIDTNDTVPAGAEIYTYDSDLWGNGGHQSAATNMRQMIELGFGGHDVVDPSKAVKAVTFTQDGVTTTVFTRRHDVIVQSLIDQGVPIQRPEMWDKTLDDFAPINILPGDNKKPNFRAGITDGAAAADAQIDPSGNFHPISDFVNQLPEGTKQFGANLFEGGNDIADTATKIGAGQIDPLTGAMSIMRGLSKMGGGFSTALPQNLNLGQAPTSATIPNAIGNLTNQYSGSQFNATIKQVIQQPAAPYIPYEKPYAATSLPPFVAPPVELPPAVTLPPVVNLPPLPTLPAFPNFGANLSVNTPPAPSDMGMAPVAPNIGIPMTTLPVEIPQPNQLNNMFTGLAPIEQNLFVDAVPAQ